MLIQRAGSGTLFPAGFVPPHWSSLSKQWARQTPSLSSPITTLGPATVILGHDDSEADDVVSEFMYDVDGHDFGWDNESPARAIEVAKFKIEWRPITNLEFHTFWAGEGHGNVNMPRSWVNEGDEIMVTYLALYSWPFKSLSFNRFGRSMVLCLWKLPKNGPY